MKHEIDIFTDIDRVEYPNIEPVEPGELLTIVFHGGTFGNFLRYFLEKWVIHYFLKDRKYLAVKL